jgi:hypothetical protein
MSMRRFTRLTNAFSKKVDNHGHAVALCFMFYNFCRVHHTSRVTPAMEAGIADHVWSFEELVKLIEPNSILDGLKKTASSIILAQESPPASGSLVFLMCRVGQRSNRVERRSVPDARTRLSPDFLDPCLSPRK